MSKPSQKPPQQPSVDPQQLMSYYQNLVERVQQLESTELQLTSAITELRNNLETLTGLKTYPNDSNVMLPLGGLLFIETNLSETGKVLVDAGSGTFIPSTFDEAAQTITTRLNDMMQYLQRLLQEKEKMEAEANQIQSYLNQMQ